MSRSTLLEALAAAAAGGVLASACVEITPEDRDCARACEVATRCGLLPSALGGSPDLSKRENEEDCVDRCLSSDRRAPQVAGLLDVLNEPGNIASLNLCNGEGVDACEELIEELELDPATNALEVTSQLTVRMISGFSYANNFSLQSWCCFDYAYDIDDGTPQDRDGSTGDGIDELAAIYDIFEPTRTCIETIQLAAEALVADLDPALQPMDEPDPMVDPETQEACSALSLQWKPKPDDDGVDTDPDDESDICRYARMSSAITALGIQEAAMACEFDSMRDVSEGLKDIRKDWHLDNGDLLVDRDGNLRELEDLRGQIHTFIREELTRPRGFLEEACVELFEELATVGLDCETLDRSVSPNPCPNGPKCGAADCLDESTDCDATLCEADVSPPGIDCAFYGVEEIKLGYKTEEGLTFFGDPIDNCPNLTSVEIVIDDVKAGVVQPIAVVSGRLGLEGGGEATSDGEYSWYLEGDPRWIPAGTSEIEVASPVLDQLERYYNNPLEVLGWVPERAPIGQECDNRPARCEGLFNENCEDGIDNDEDGYTDQAAAWCDGLLNELVDRCIVEIPGEVVPSQCRSDGGEDPAGEPVPDGS